MNLKKFDELMKDFNRMCYENFCENCKYKDLKTRHECISAYIYEQLVEALHGTEVSAKPATADKMEAVQLPKWCKVGAWVLMNNDLYKIVELNGDPYYPLTMEDIHGGRSFAHPNIVYPVRFRPYTYEEAKGLLGKTMEYRVRNECSSVRYSMLISRVSFNPDSGEVFIHSCSFSDWWGYEPTIDGIPIGIPEVDEEAMKEGEE